MMNGWLWLIIGMLLCVNLALAWKIYMLRKNAKEIAQAFGERLKTDTNVLIDISGKDSCMRMLASSINGQLRHLREQRHRYRNGDRELKEAVTNISHDLRTPLTVICGYLELLEREETSENAVRYLNIIRNRTDAMRRLAEEMFRYSIVLSAQERMVMEEICINDVLESCMVDFYGALTERGITPDILITASRVIRRGNKEALSRVFYNILGNAVKYSDGDLEVSLREDGQIQFVNSASGLDDVRVGQLFDRYFTVKTAQNANGLGLSIARILMEQMGGAVTARYLESRLYITLSLPQSPSESYAYQQQYP